jgi:hypothetical protein
MPDVPGIDFPRLWSGPQDRTSPAGHWGVLGTCGALPAMVFAGNTGEREYHEVAAAGGSLMLEKPE